MEGISQEAISLAGHLKLGKLICVLGQQLDLDRRRHQPRGVGQPDGAVPRLRLACAGDRRPRHGCDPGCDQEARSVTDKPSMIACRTIIGFGLPTKAGTQKAHSDAPGEGEIAGARKILGWDAPPFVIPEHLLAAGARSAPRGGRPHGLGRRVKRRPTDRRRFERRNKADFRTIGSPRSPRPVPSSRGQQGTGNPPSQRSCAEPPVRRDPGAPRRLGRPDTFKQHQGEEPGRNQARATTTAPTCITACGSTAWRRQ